MKVIKGVLGEELGNSLRQEAAFRKALEALPQGALVKKKIKGHSYFYLIRRENGKVRFSYLGKISPAEIKKHEEAKKLRKKYREHLSLIKKQISFLRKALNAKAIRSA
jgi:hypothetical protein